MQRPPLFTRPFVFAALATLMLSLAGFLFVHLPGFLQELGAGEAEIGRVMSAQALGAILAWPLVGRIMDRRGRRVVILGGCGLYVLVVALYLPIGSVSPFVYLVRLLDGAAQTMWYTALFTFGADLVPPQRRTEGLAIFGVSAIIPIGLGAMFGDAILLHADYRALFLGALGFALAGFLLCLPLRDVPLTGVPAERSPAGLFAAALQRSLLPVWIAAFAFFVSLLALFSFMKTFVLASGVGDVGDFFGIYAATAVALRLLAGWLPDRLGVRRMLGISMGCYALGFLLLMQAQTPLQLLLAGILCGTGHGYTYPVLFSLVVERAVPSQRGSAMACYTAIDWGGLLVAGPAVGLLIEHAGYSFAFAALALLLGTAIGLFYALDRPRAPAAANAADRH